MTQKQRIDELRKQMSICLRSGHMTEYLFLLSQLATFLHPKNQLKQESSRTFTKS